MTTMDRLADLLGDVDDLLHQADDQTITEALERGEAPDHADVDDRCPWCGHGFHGLGCYLPPAYVPSVPFEWSEDYDPCAALTLTEPHERRCRCDSSLTRPDDTWRPISGRDEHLEVMAETGLDGWAALAELHRRRRAHYEEMLRARQEAHDRRRRENHTRQLCRHMDATGLDGWAAQADLNRDRPDVTVGAYLSRYLDALGVAATRALEVWMDLGDRVFIAPPGTPPPTWLEYSAGGTVTGGHDDTNDPPLADWERALIGEAFVPEPPLSPQARALQLRQNRHTGPERPPAGRARRPRRHGG